MMDIGINYISQDAEDVYELLIKRGIINTLKFPGKTCNFANFEEVINISKKNKNKLDIHGLPNMIPAIYSENYVKNVNWEKIKETFYAADYDLNTITRTSTSMELDRSDKFSNHSNEELDKMFYKNIEKVKKYMFNILGHKITVGTENVAGSFGFEKEIISPDFTNKNWEKADFGVFDISHAKLAANELNISYEEYLQKLRNVEKVKILHVSGNIDETGKCNNRTDKHVRISKDEIKYVIQAIRIFKNLDLVVSEYAYNTKYSYRKEIAIEAVVLNTIVNTIDEVKAIKMLKLAEEKINEDASNLNEVLDKINM